MRLVLDICWLAKRHGFSNSQRNVIMEKAVGFKIINKKQVGDKK